MSIYKGPDAVMPMYAHTVIYFHLIDIVTIEIYKFYNRGWSDVLHSVLASNTNIVEVWKEITTWKKHQIILQRCSYKSRCCFFVIHCGFIQIC